MAFAPLIIAGVGLGLGATAQWKAGSAAKKQGEAQRRAAESQAELFEFNATVAEQQSKDAIERGREDEARFLSAARLLTGEQRADFAASGVVVDQGSAADVRADVQHLVELDVLTTRNNAAREAWGFTQQAEDLKKRAEIARKEGVMLEEAGRAAQTSARIGAVGGLLTGAGSLMLQRYGREPQTPQPRRG